ncbi:cytochrome P450 [Sporodiniella umbellata]|nr:cytochrome P450 [Sporodiniella umbellata]
MSSSLFYIALFGLSLISIYFFTQKKPNAKGEIKEIPTPNTVKLPIFGHMLSLGSAPFTKLMKWHREVGPIFKLNIGDQVWVMIDDPYLAHEVFVKAGHTTSSRPNHRYIKDIYSKNRRGVLFSTYGQIWRNNRTHITNLLKPGSIDRFYEFLPEQIDLLMERLTKLAMKGEAFDPAPEFQLAAMNVLLQVLFAKKFNSIRDPGVILLYEVVNQLIEYSGITGDLSAFLPSLSWVDVLLGTEKKQKTQNNKLTQARDWLIEEAMNSKNDSFIKELFKIRDEEKTITTNDIKVLITDLIVASTATSADTPHWAFNVIAQAPHIQDRIIKELDSWKAKNPSRKVPNFFDDREEFPYTISVQKEVLRFRPPGPGGVSHACSEDTVVNGYLIPKDATLVASILSMHFNPNVYEDPDVFNPERFMDKPDKMSTLANGNIEKRDHYSFGWGRRICPGIYLSEMESFEFFVHFFSKFTVHPSPNALKKGLGLGAKDYNEVGTLIRPIDPTVILKIRE